MDASYLRAKFTAALSYDDYLRTGTPQQIESWTRLYQQARLTAAQQELIGSFTRRINALVVSGIWCGDCVQQCPLIERVARAKPATDGLGGTAAGLDVRYVDRDQHVDLQKKVRVNAGDRVPVVLFLAEDFELVGWFGDRTLNRYRAIAARQLGPACPLPGASMDHDELAATIHDWVDQFERVHLLLRLSARLRRQHGD